MTKEDVLFDGLNSLTDDKCAVETRTKQNRAAAALQVDNQRGSSKERSKEFAQQHRNLRSWDGYGVDTSRIDVDSKFRNEQIWTNDPFKTQLNTRTFTAVPNLWRGRAMPDTESVLQNGQDTTSKKMCNPLTEKQFPVFHPTLLPVCTKHIVPQWTRGGDSSREIARSPDFMKSLGYKYDGRMWVRNC